MNKPNVGEIRRFAGESAPSGWVFCDGQELQVEEYQDLYEVIGVAYGGDGVSTFKIPKLRHGQARKKAEASIAEHFIMATEGLEPDWFGVKLTKQF